MAQQIDGVTARSYTEVVRRVQSFDPPQDELRRRATAGFVKTGLSQMVRLAMQFLSAVLLGRLLGPEDFGLFAMAAPVLAFACMFQDLGMTQAVVQKPGITQDEVSTLFFISLASSLTLAVVLLLASPLVGDFYSETRVVALTAAMAINIVVGGLGSLPYALLSRRMQFGALAAIDGISAISAVIASVTFAWFTHSYWALYAGYLVNEIVPTTGYWLLAKWQPSRPRRNSGATAALHFGINVTGTNFAGFFSRNMDNILIGRVWGERPLGLYDRAYKLLMLPLQQVNVPIAKIMLPVLSQMAGQPERYRQAYLSTMAQMLLGTLPGIAFMVGAVDVLIPLLLGHQWTDASPIFAVLGINGFIQILNGSGTWLFISQNRTREMMYWGLFNSLTSVVSYALGLPYGPMGVAVAFTIGSYIRMPLMWWYLTRQGPVRHQDITRMAAPHFLAALASLAAIASIRALLPGNVYLVLFASLTISYLAAATVLAAFPDGRKTIGHSLALMRQGFGRVAGPRLAKSVEPSPVAQPKSAS